MPKYEYKPLKDIDKKINKVIEKYNLHSSNSVEGAILGKQNFYLTVSKFQGSKILFKARIADHRVLKQWNKNFKNERRLLRTLEKTDPKNPLVECLPVYIKSQMQGCEWLMCEYINKKTVGSSNIIYDTPQKEEINQIINLLIKIQSFPIEDFCKSHHWTKNLIWMDFDKYHMIFHRFKNKKSRILKEILGEELMEKADEIILDSKDLLDGSCTLFTHGDFHPANIIINDHAIAIDWETLHIDNCAWDLTTLWMRMLERPEERKFLLQKFYQKTRQNEFFPELFRLSLLCRILEEISMIWYPLSQNLSIRSKQREIYQNNLEICRKNYQIALEGGKLTDYV
ncbi:MAG: phosphotransferase [bacterium]|nr:phosphotransferase [bacterium]